MDTNQPHDMAADGLSLKDEATKKKSKLNHSGRIVKDVIHDFMNVTLDIPT